ncbi:hypothetical protein ACKVMT_06240 [Halobacteriales archaeon Cl-PHB]
MPRLNATRRSGPTPATQPLREHLKAVLSCPECGHESPVDGDWVHRNHHDGVRVCCPSCDAHLTTREA